MITQLGGRYVANFYTNLGSGTSRPMLTELAESVDVQVLYQGSLDNNNLGKVRVIMDLVKEANKSGKFSLKLLEARLSE